MLAEKAASLSSFCFHSFFLSTYFSLGEGIRKRKRHNRGVECGRLAEKEREEPGLIAIPSVCIEHRGVSSDRLREREEGWGWGASGAHWLWVCLETTTGEERGMSGGREGGRKG